MRRNSGYRRTIVDLRVNLYISFKCVFHTLSPELIDDDKVLLQQAAGLRTMR